MADYIDRQAAIDVVANHKQVTINLLESLPSADAIEVMRCKDCKHSTEWYRDKRRCFLWHENGIDVFEDGYCSYGERKDG